MAVFPSRGRFGTEQKTQYFGVQKNIMFLYGTGGLSSVVRSQIISVASVVEKAGMAKFFQPVSRFSPLSIISVKLHTQNSTILYKLTN
jgi:hypothetical protein